MREILFRGMSVNSIRVKSEWVYGSLDLSLNNSRQLPRIINHNLESYYGSRYVVPETIGQYTGLKDKNGVKIFEGDIKQWVFNNLIYKSECYWSYIDNGFRWKLIDHNCKLKDHDGDIFSSTEEEYYYYIIKSNQRQNGFDRWSTIIGNIHEVYP